MGHTNEAGRWVKRFSVPILALSLLQACGADGESGGTGFSEEATGQATEALGVDAGGITDPALTKTLTVTFTLAPGAETSTCRTFANPWGAQVDVKDYITSVSSGVMDLAAFYVPNATTGSPATCAPLNGTEQLTFFSASSSIEYKYPGAVGATITSAMGFNVHVHALNTGATPITVTASLTMKVAYPGIVTKPAGLLWLENTTMTVPPGSHTSTATYVLPQQIKVVAETGVMTRYGTSLTLSAGTTTLYQTNLWNEPPIHLEPTQIVLASGTTLTWSCQYANPTGTTLTFGESALTNAKCRAIAFFYSVPDVNRPRIGNTWTP